MVGQAHGQGGSFLLILPRKVARHVGTKRIIEDMLVLGLEFLQSGFRCDQVSEVSIGPTQSCVGIELSLF